MTMFNNGLFMFFLLGILQRYDVNADVSCEPDTFRCGDGNCIVNNWRCDGYGDCEDASDESDCADVSCEPDQFRCGDGDCIPNDHQCDDFEDCEDRSDELECVKTCTEKYFTCENGKCIDHEWTCDGDNDCSDNSDEKGCEGDHTEECDVHDKFQCVKPKECIQLSWKCNGSPDCIDGSDEGDFCNYTCREDQFKCNNNICIPDSQRCDETGNCFDGSDEWNCTIQVKCHEKEEFDCYGDNSYCIPNNKVCDGYNDCDHREDEEKALCKQNDPCEGKVCPDHSTCQKEPISNDKLNATCVCDGGFEWHHGGKVCKKMDECKERGLCSQICVNTKEGHKCGCRVGYTLEKHYFCRADGKVPWLYYANIRDIRKLSINRRFEEVVVDATHKSVALDIDIEQNLLFYIDNGGRDIYSLTINNTSIDTGKKPQVVISNSEFAANGIAVDWLYKHIYWTDTASRTIKVSKHNGNYVKTLISTGLEEPRSIALDPEHGQIYWTDTGTEPKIERCGMDGNNRKTVIAKGDSLHCPNGLTIDYVDRRIFWIDAKLDKIGSAKMDGSDYNLVCADATEIQRPFSIAVFEDSLYWTDWHTNSIRSVNKITGHNPTTLSLGSYSVMDIKVYHAMRQDRHCSSTAMTLCNNAQCEQLCLPRARFDSNATQLVVCACSDGRTLNGDEKTCAKYAVVSTTPKQTTTKHTTPRHRKVTTLCCPTVTTMKSVTSPSPVGTMEGIFPTSDIPHNQTGTITGSGANDMPHNGTGASTGSRANEVTRMSVTTSSPVGTTEGIFTTSGMPHNETGAITVNAQEVTRQNKVTTANPVATTEGGYTILTTSTKARNESEPHSGSEPSGKIALIVAVCVGIVFILGFVVS